MSGNEREGQAPLLEVKDFSMSFLTYEKGLKEADLEVVKNFNMTIHEGEIVAVLGASGSGKSLLANAILGILPENARTSGTLNYKGEALTEKRQEVLRGKEISLIPQSVNALDPLMKAKKQVRSMVRGRHKKAVQRDVFQKVGLSESVGENYPFQLSGGMARRVLAATSMISSAKLVVADEPTPGLDPAVLQETVKQLRRLADEGKGMMFITHDIEIALQVADKIAVFYEGETIEIASAEDFSGEGERLVHPYTKALWNALPGNGFKSSVHPEGMRHLNYKCMHDAASERYPLDVEKISYHYPGQPPVFEGLSMQIMPGEIVGIYGNSGSGKSTMAQIIAGYRDPSEGMVQIGRKRILQKGIHPVQMIWQHPEKAVNPRWRIRKALLEAGPLNPELLDIFGIRQEWLKRWPGELSGGELQRFCLVRALTGDIDYLIADEMTTMLDAVTQAQIWHSLIKLSKERGIGVAAISHDYQLLEKVCDRIIHFTDLQNS
ncbi:ABC transporter ATP-binding protein [Salinicoccus carnicancri]|uniref:ABC transporter ATP-binding protein n=1 Tax=Salinicoccus carnicancri TaxID=558170 RepID=UPI0003023103|nr:ATP-binding cassette domain-containing protein [Salinicoccus carnicancri]